MRILKTLKELRAYREFVKGSIGFVPTMGALHEGHLSLAQKSIDENDVTIASIFVNPAQFAPNEDFDKYPRTFEKDAQLLEDLGVDAIWAPSVSEIYPNDFKSTVRVSGISEMLEGVSRPHFFEGVTTIVNKLFMQVQPSRAYFGVKDYQQLRVIQKMVEDFNIPIEVIGCPVIRDEEGLALSSRNVYLTPTDLAIARQLNVILEHASVLVKSMNVQEVEKQLENDILKAGFDKIDYITLRSAQTLEEIKTVTDQEIRVLVATYLGSVRLIDNRVVI